MASGNIGKMDYERVNDIASGFDDAGNVLKVVDTALQALLVILRTTAFIGLVGGIAVERYIANIQPHIKNLAALCEEYGQKLRQAISNHQAAVAASKPTFND
jgi:hypothetical protein